MRPWHKKIRWVIWLNMEYRTSLCSMSMHELGKQKHSRNTWLVCCCCCCLGGCTQRLVIVLCTTDLPMRLGCWFQFCLCHPWTWDDDANVLLHAVPGKMAQLWTIKNVLGQDPVESPWWSESYYLPINEWFIYCPGIPMSRLLVYPHRCCNGQYMCTIFTIVLWVTSNVNPGLINPCWLIQCSHQIVSILPLKDHRPSKQPQSLIVENSHFSSPTANDAFCLTFLWQEIVVEDLPMSLWSHGWGRILMDLKFCQGGFWAFVQLWHQDSPAQRKQSKFQ